MYKIQTENGTIETDNVALAVEVLIYNNMMDVPDSSVYEGIMVQD